MINAYYIKSIKHEKSNEVFWVNVNIATNKELKYVFVSDNVQHEFCDRIKKFVENELYYKERGLPYKKSFLLHGPPGCGKTSLLKAISVEYNLPVFIFNLGSLDNENLISLLFEINNYLKKSERYIVLLEDFDRILEKIQKSNRGGFYDDDYGNSRKNNLTMDCILNFLDGIDESYGRITLITANNITGIMSNDALCRPGRIDHMVKLDFCNKEQIQKISNIYNFELTNDIIEKIESAKITPAKLINAFSVSCSNDELLEQIKNNIDDCNEGINMEKVVNQTNGIYNRRKLTSRKRQRNNASDMTNQELDRKRRRVESALRRVNTEIKKCNSKKVENNVDKKIHEIEKQIANLKKEKILCEKEKVIKIIDIKTKYDDKSESESESNNIEEANIEKKNIEYDIMLNKISEKCLVDF
jgi:SpoVK/Ycf46/Vps4 family AAA+-type ATPase